jgi:hypothetical protein
MAVAWVLAGYYVGQGHGMLVPPAMSYCVNSELISSKSSGVSVPLA